jgi:hypothetical protein
MEFFIGAVVGVLCVLIGVSIARTTNNNEDI